MPGAYWDMIGRRMSRRRALAGAAAAGGGLAAITLVGCGGGKGDQGAAPAARELSALEDTTDRAKQGGVYKGSRTADVSSFEPHVSLTSELPSYSLSRLTMPKPAKLAPFDGARQGDLAESWEIAGDGLQVTMKLRTNAFMQLASGKRPVDAQDVLFTYERFVNVAEYRSALSNRLSPQGAPILSLTAPDSRTLVFKLAFPFAAFLAILDYLWLLPKEADTQFDPRAEIHGSGPWILDEWRPGARLVWRRNPDWHIKGRPFMDKVEEPILPEYASRLAQFRARNIHTQALNLEDILPTRSDLPGLRLYAKEWVNSLPLFVLGLQKAPFKDERVRQALMMSMDRDLWIDIFYNVEKYKAAGVASETRYNTMIGLAHPKFWLDPRGKDFGASSKYLKLDVAEAKKLMSAAGLATGAKSQVIVGGTTVSNQVVALLDMFKQNIGFEFSVFNVPGADIEPKYLQSKGGFDGILSTSFSQHSIDPGIVMYQKHHSGESSDRLPDNIDPKLDQLLVDQFRELDEKKRLGLIQEFQRYTAEKVYYLFHPGQGTPYQLAWPELQNYGVFSNGGSSISSNQAMDQIGQNYWLDPSKVT